MRIGTPEHDAYLRELAELSSTSTLRTKSKEELEWQASIVDAAIAENPNADAVRRYVQAAHARGPKLPELSLEQQRELLSTVVQAVWIRRGEPSGLADQGAFDAEVVSMFAAARDLEQERAAPAWIRERLLLRRLQLLPGIRTYLGLGPLT